MNSPENDTPLEYIAPQIKIVKMKVTLTSTLGHFMSDCTLMDLEAATSDFDETFWELLTYMRNQQT